MFETELRNRKQSNDSKLVLYGDSIILGTFFFLIFLFLIGLLYEIILLLEGFEVAFKSATIGYTISNVLNTILIGFIILLAILLIIGALRFFQPILLRKKIVIDQFSVQVKYIFIFVPIFTKDFSIDEGKIAVYTNGEEKTLKPTMSKEKMFLLVNNQKYFIRSFRKIDSDEKMQLVIALYRHGLSVDQDLRQQIPLDEIEEDLDLDISLD